MPREIPRTFTEPWAPAYLPVPPITVSVYVVPPCGDRAHAADEHRAPGRGLTCNVERGEAAALGHGHERRRAVIAADLRAPLRSGPLVQVLGDRELIASTRRAVEHKAVERLTLTVIDGRSKLNTFGFPDRRQPTPTQTATDTTTSASTTA